MSTLAPFAQTSNDEDREFWATQYQPGSFWVLTNRSTYDQLPEYRQWQATAPRRAASVPASTGPEFFQAQSSTVRPILRTNDVFSIFIPYFDESGSSSPQTPAPLAELPSLSALTWQQTQARMTYMQRAVSPVPTEFGGLSHQPPTPPPQLQCGCGEPSHRAGHELFTSAGDHFHHSSLSLAIPQQIPYTQGHGGIHSAPVQASGTQPWSFPPSERPDMGSRTGSFLEDLICGRPIEQRREINQHPATRGNFE